MSERFNPSAIRFDGGTGAGALAALQAQQAASQSFVNSLKGILGVADDLQKREDQHWDAQAKYNTRMGLDAINAIDNPDDLAKARAGLMEQFKGYGAQADQAALLSALNNQASVLQNRIKGAAEFQDWKNNETDKPHRDAVDQLLAQDPTGESAQKYIAANQFANPGAMARYVRDNTNSSIEKELKLSSLKREVEASNETDQTNRLMSVIAQKSMEHRNLRDQQGLEIGSHASRLGLPMNRDGTANLDVFNDAQRKQLQDELTKFGGSNLAEYETGDTALANQFESAIASGKHGTFSNKVILQNRAAIRGALDSSTGRGSMGNTAYAKNVASALDEAAMKVDAEDSWNPIGSNEARQSSEKVIAEINNLIPADDRIAVRKVVDEMFNHGIPIKFKDKDGKEQVRNVAPSAKYVIGKLGSINDSWLEEGSWVMPWNTKDGPKVPWYQLGNASLADKIKFALTNEYDNDAVAQAAIKAENWNAYNKKKESRRILLESLKN